MTTGPASPDDPEQLQAAIEQTREELGRTVEQLVAKTDVKARAQAKVSDLTQRAKDATSQVRHQAAAQASSAREQLAGTYQAAGPLVNFTKFPPLDENTLATVVLLVLLTVTDTGAESLGANVPSPA